MGFIKHALDWIDSLRPSEQEREADNPLIFSIRKAVRPASFSSFVGNEKAVKRLQQTVKASQKRNLVLPHILFYGPAGVGKTTLSKIMAKEINAQLLTITGSTVRTQKDIYQLFVRIDMIQRTGKSVILFIDEIHDLGKGNAQETLWYPVLEEFMFYHNLNGKTISIEGTEYTIMGTQVSTDPFTIVGATTDPGDLNKPLRDRFQVTISLQSYSIENLKRILQGHADQTELHIAQEAIQQIAQRSRANPRIAINILNSCRDHSSLKDEIQLSEQTVKDEMELQDIDDIGLGLDDRKILKALSDSEKGLGIINLAGTVNMHVSQVKMLENYLKQIGFIQVTTRRICTDLGRTYLEGSS